VAVAALAAETPQEIMVDVVEVHQHKNKMDHQTHHIQDHQTLVEKEQLQVVDLIQLYVDMMGVDVLLKLM
tara:strand:+ start:170 stop:379 length:210 start_codon:yes stop_codon:yes gene_type:complete